MARIRSVHPGFWTDETTVELSIPARLFVIGLWNECDDQGAFEWKPKALKMRLFPVDHIDIDGLLSELEGNNVIRSYISGGRKFGVVRNFCRFQRPKKPNKMHPMTPELRTYAGYRDDTPEETVLTTDASSPPVPHRFPTGGEKSPQRKGEREDVKEEAKPAISVTELARGKPPHPCINDPPEAWMPLANWECEVVNGPGGPIQRPVLGGFYLDDAARLVTEAAGINDANWRGDWRPLVSWLNDKLDLHDAILPAIRRVADRPGYVVPRSLAYFDQAVREGRAAA